MLEQIEILEKARLYKKADAILRKVISEEREYAPQIETETSTLENLLHFLHLSANQNNFYP